MKNDRNDKDRPRKSGKPEGKPGGKREGFKGGDFKKRDGDKPRFKSASKGARDEARQDERPRSDRPGGDGPKRERTFGDRPHGDRPKGARGAGSDKPKRDWKKNPPRPGKRERAEQAAGDAASLSVSAKAGEAERIAKRLARAGVASRREAEDMITAGRVSVNGKVLETPAFTVTDRDRIEVDGNPLPAIERTRLFLFHKPSGVVTTSHDPEGRRTLFDILPAGLPRLMTVGRLDINTEGLILLTNDGGLKRILELPATGWLRRYRVRVHGKVDTTALAGLADGIAVDGVFYGAIEATLDREQGSNAWLTVGLREGKNREVKNVLGAIGLEVTRLIRVSYGPFQLGALPEGAVQEIKGKMLRDQLGERLLEEAGANLDAPIATPFSNKPVKAERKPRVEQPASDRDDARKPFNRKKAREERREELRDRLQTKPGRNPRDGEPRGEKTRGPKKTEAYTPRSRSSNVWMAPGARPVGKKKKEEMEAAEARPKRQTERSQRGKPDGKPGFGKDKPSFAKKQDGNPGFKGRPAGAGRRRDRD
ncbi:pseudouridine synthase [Nitratireductor sp. CH_MIT9313-5]|uniref:pseudouridine synthase n=1 Tax=Nitratireductor sp. CH_MIT9313-5 TaxID=3107764 RepID=UPI0030093F68